MLTVHCPSCGNNLGTSLTSCMYCGWYRIDPIPRENLTLPPPVGFVASGEHARIVTAARRDALEAAAKVCDDEADKCDDAVKWGGHPKYIANCKAAAYAMRDRAAAIRALAEKG